MRIANCSGFYGDRLSAAAEQVEGGQIDVLCGDYLAELTMALLLRDRMKDPNTGYAKTFLIQLRQVMAACLDRDIKVVANAGGLNPKGLAAAVRSLADELGLRPRIAWVEGDAVQNRLAQWQKDGNPLAHMDTGEPLTAASGVPVSANAYLGCWPIARALERGADIVITGRCTDAAVVMGAVAHGHGWKQDDFDPLAGALVAGHIIECGTQATGGNLSFYDEVPGLDSIGFPIAEIAADGSSVITKHAGTGGTVTLDTVKAQLLYEIGPPLYVSPDVVADFRTIALSEEGPDRVRVSATRGYAPPSTLKVGLNLTAGHRNQVKVLLGGPQVQDKAERVEAAFWSRVGGTDAFLETRSELIGGASDPETPTDALAVLLLSARAANPNTVGRRFTAAAVELALASVPGITLLDPPGPPRPCIRFWPVAVERSQVPVTVHVDGAAEVQPLWEPPPSLPPEPPASVDRVSRASHEVLFGELVGTRSGDKAGKVNIGFWVRDPEHVGWLCTTVTEAWVASVLRVDAASVDVHVLPSLGAVNVVVHGWLGMGVGTSLAADAQGKCLAEFFRTLLVPGPVDA